MEWAENSIAENLPDPLFILDGIGKNIRWVNSACEAWLGRSCASIVGRLLVDISSDFAPIYENMILNSDPNTTLRGYDLAIALRGQNAGIFNYQVFPSTHGQEEGGRALLINIQAMKPPSAESADASVNMLGRMLAHELKNPLAGIRGAAQLLEADLHLPDDLELTELIKTEVDRISRLADSMENFGNTKSLTSENFNIHMVLRKAVLLFNNQSHEGVEIIENYDPSLPMVFGDRDALMQVMINLISNGIEAVKAIRSDGRIEICTGFRTGIKRRTKSGRSYALPVEVRIIDNGPGINPTIRERIFHPFVTSKANGQGLGLSLVSKIVSEHGGIIDVISESGRTEFSVLLPIENLNDETSYA